LKDLSIPVNTPQQWAERHFGGAALSDIRRVDRVQASAEAMAARPGKSLPQLFAHPYDMKAAYHLFQLAEATPDNLHVGHRQAVLEALEQPGVYLLLEDTSELSWAGHLPIAGLGPVGASKDGQQGFLLHSVLAVGWKRPTPSDPPAKRLPVEVLGLADQQYHVRQPRPAGERSQDHWRRKSRRRESELWWQASRRIGTAPDSAAVRWVRVADRGADIYELLHSCQQAGQGFVVRAAQNRALIDPPTGKSVGHLFEAVRQQPELGRLRLELRARPGQPARTAQLRVSAVGVQLRAPRRPGPAAGPRPPLACSAVRVWEEQAPAGIQPLEWVLLCDQSVGSFVSAREVALEYSARWLLEEFHKALKTGLGAERLQLKKAPQLFAAIAVMSVVALRLIELREQLRLDPQAPAASSGLDRLELEVLALATRRRLHTVGELALAIGRLGGHLNRKGDGLPGWITLWRGMGQLNALVEGARLASRLKQVNKRPSFPLTKFG
jgi:Transposase DNA-binding/Transposase Tn5 dimerisation domain